MYSRSCHWLIVSALLITASGAWAQQSAPPASDQKDAASSLWQGWQGLWRPPAFDQKSFAAFKQQAASGDAAAQCGLGLMYARGPEPGVPCAYCVPKDDTQAAFWLRKAAEQGLAVAQGALGNLYENGRGVPQDYAQAILWYRKAAEQGYAPSQSSLGLAYYYGQGVPQDYAQAALWYRKAAEQGLDSAQFTLGDLYYKGQGVPQDYAEAYFWLDLAAAGARNGTWAESPTRDRDKVASHLTPADLSREQERARKWFEAHPAKPQ
jgi:TPR repeat protein